MEYSEVQLWLKIVFSIRIKLTESHIVMGDMHAWYRQSVIPYGKNHSVQQTGFSLYRLLYLTFSWNSPLPSCRGKQFHKGMEIVSWALIIFAQYRQCPEDKIRYTLHLRYHVCVVCVLVLGCVVCGACAHAYLCMCMCACVWCVCACVSVWCVCVHVCLCILCVVCVCVCACVSVWCVCVHVCLCILCVVCVCVCVCAFCVCVCVYLTSITQHCTNLQRTLRRFVWCIDLRREMPAFEPLTTPHCAFGSSPAAASCRTCVWASYM